MSRKPLGLAQKYQDADEEGRQLIVDGLPYERGYLKPPVEHRFKPGNKAGRGRPRGSKNLRTQLRNALQMKVAIKENGRTKKVDASQASLFQLAAKSAQGDLKATQQLFELVRKAGLLEGDTAETPEPMLTDADVEIWRQVSALMANTVPATPEHNDEDEGAE
jgi:hypothetical protein